MRGRRFSLNHSMNETIYFRQVNEPYSIRNVFWHVEYYEGSPLFPVGLCVVAAVGGGAQLNFVFVADQWRGRGIARKLVSACIGRWPNLQGTLGISDGGDALLRMLPSCADIDE